MPFKIAVCVKSVPDPDHYDKIVIHPEKKTLIRTGIPSVINGSDKHALELAITIKEKFGGEVTAITMGPTDAQTQLYEALAMGADKAVLLSDMKVAGSDTLATSYVLSELLKSLDDFDLVLAGNESDDGATAQVPSQLGEWLHLPHIMDVVSVEVEDEKSIVAHKEVEYGTAVYRLQTPCLIAVKKKINTVRYTTMMGLFAAKSKPMTVLSAGDLANLNEDIIGLNGSPTQSGDLRTLDCDRCAQVIQGSEEEIAATILDKINALIQIK